KSGKFIFSGGDSLQTMEKDDRNLLSGFVGAFQSLAQELGQEEMKEAQLGSSKLFFTKDKITEISFVIKAEATAKKKKMFQLLEKIKNLFINTFMGHMYEESEAKNYLFESFAINLDNLIKDNTDEKVKGFFNGL
ncbi:MAG: hypothetical protein ACFE8P_09890, partial [Promethearchaeota archaeon]